MSRPEEASYVYAVCRPFDTATVNGLTGVGGHPVHFVVDADLAAAVSTVPLDEFDEQALHAKLEDLRWLEEVARAHHGVVDEVAARVVTVPLRLATVYRGDERVRQVLREHGEAFDASLRELLGRVELGVKVYADAGARAADPPVPAASVGESPGKAYLRKRRDQRNRRDDTWQKAVRLCDRVDEVLAGLASACARHQPQSAALSAAAGENVMNNAYLVDQERVADFFAAADELSSQAPEGTRVEVSGPWAPYSFANASATGVGP
ncbi:GvpL/GvpF family gas vesicle protein [Nocardiopsis ganjiahuensis]|uniref:GvpL/GvpF family gas vesicle protein n=1 Tax=Nocardiopsis ganjiahuensis TaxID=239984 RepID=UPI00034C6764|nr:GvpL/GvpF family gas vesicle protein [Nocardiopsis ganjiahuensis]